MIPMERTHEYHGVYHVLGGALSPIDGIDPEDLKIAELLARVAAAPDGAGARGRAGDQPDDHRRGDRAAHRRGAARALAEVTVTRLASGLPVGSDLEYADEVTLGKALRRPPRAVARIRGDRPMASGRISWRDVQPDRHEVRRHVGRRRRAHQARGAADRARSAKQGHRVVAVLSARGKTTDELIAMAEEVSAAPDPREMDMLLSTGERISCALCAMAINDLGHRAISLTGSQAGIVTDESHTKALILDVRADRIRAALDEDSIVLVAGFQGVSRERRATSPRSAAAAPTRAPSRSPRRSAPRCARSTPTSRASTRPTRASCPTRASSTRSPSRRCSRWPRRARACCSCARSSTRATTACASTAAPRSTSEPGTVVLAEGETDGAATDHRRDALDRRRRA